MNLILHSSHNFHCLNIYRNIKSRSLFISSHFRRSLFYWSETQNGKKTNKQWKNWSDTKLTHLKAVKTCRHKTVFFFMRKSLTVILRDLLLKHFLNSHSSQSDAISWVAIRWGICEIYCLSPIEFAATQNNTLYWDGKWSRKVIAIVSSRAWNFCKYFLDLRESLLSVSWMCWCLWVETRVLRHNIKSQVVALWEMTRLSLIGNEQRRRIMKCRSKWSRGLFRECLIAISCDQNWLDFWSFSARGGGNLLAPLIQRTCQRSRQKTNESFIFSFLNNQEHMFWFSRSKERNHKIFFTIFRTFLRTERREEISHLKSCFSSLQTTFTMFSFLCCC